MNRNTSLCRRDSQPSSQDQAGWPIQPRSLLPGSAKCSRRRETPLAGYYKSIPCQDSWGIFSKELASQQLACLEAEQFIMILGFSYGAISHSMAPPFSYVMFAKTCM